MLKVADTVIDSDGEEKRRLGAVAAGAEGGGHIEGCGTLGGTPALPWLRVLKVADTVANNYGTPPANLLPWLRVLKVADTGSKHAPPSIALSCRGCGC